MAPSVATAPAASRPVAKQPSTPRVVAAAPASPRRQQFFRPTAVTAQEAALLRFVNQAPPEELKLLARRERAEPIPGLRVDALEIPPVIVGKTDSQ